MFDSSILQSGTLVAVVCLALAGACSGEDTGDEGTPTGAAGSSGSGGSSGGGPAAPGFTNGGSAGTGGDGGRGGSAAVAATAGGAGVGGSSGAAGVAGAAGSDGEGGAAGAGGSDGEGGAAGAGGSDDEGGTVVNYTSDAQPILQANCSPCHSGLGLGGHNAASVYDDAVRVADALLDEIESGDMPPACDGDDPGDPNCVSEEDLEVLEQWVDDDTPE